MNGNHPTQRRIQHWNNSRGFTSPLFTVAFGGWLQEAILTYAAEVYAKMPAAGKASVRSNDTTVTFDMVPVSKRVRALLRDFRCPTVWLS